MLAKSCTNPFWLFKLSRQILAVTVLPGILLLGICDFSFAGCYNAGPVTTTLNILQSLVINRNTQPGTVIYDSHWKNGGDAVIDCDGLYQFVVKYTAGYAAYDAANYIYKTSVNGIGIRAWYSNNSDPSYGYWPLSPSGYYENVDGGYRFTPASNFRVQLIVIGPLTVGASPLTLPSPTAVVTYGGVTTNQVSFNNSLITIYGQTCTVTSPFNQTVNLDAVQTFQFGGVGSSAGSVKPFSVNINCPAGMAVSYELQDSQGTGSLGPGVLANRAGAGMAQGVGVQILKSDGMTPLPLNTETFLGNSTYDNQAMNVSLSARYYKTQSTVVTGDVNAVANVVMYYR
ncbi:fimbrial protein [Pseudomonas sp. PDNC002]|uniref:fimbrial protein n=1 Tax=Pseudomonas sp. PDNC002 TaxID=2811422 RepID=UPI0019664B18|nr:fimbrial protein [Pseudomonas sp. PDNC002]QRY79778.1 fimbrial protein [Pseudomonas sp. PDNC002]